MPVLAIAKTVTLSEQDWDTFLEVQVFTGGDEVRLQDIAPARRAKYDEVASYLTAGAAPVVLVEVRQ